VYEGKSSKGEMSRVKENRKEKGEKRKEKRQKRSIQEKKLAVSGATTRPKDKKRKRSCLIAKHTVLKRDLCVVDPEWGSKKRSGLPLVLKCRYLSACHEVKNQRKIMCTVVQQLDVISRHNSLSLYKRFFLFIISFSSSSCKHAPTNGKLTAICFSTWWQQQQGRASGKK
jgi:hypothetical protein